MTSSCTVITRGKPATDAVPLHTAAKVATQPDTFVWIDLRDPTPEEFQSTVVQFALPTTVMDLTQNPHRAKLVVHEDSILLAMLTAVYVDNEEVVEHGYVKVFLGEHFVIVVHHGHGGDLSTVRRTVEQHELQHGPGAVLLAIVRTIIREYGPVLEGLDNDVDQVADQVFGPQRVDPVKRIYYLKREILGFRRASSWLDDPLNRLGHQPVPFIHEDLAERFAEQRGNLKRVVERIDALNDLLSSALDANIAQVSLRQNEDMRRLSAWAAIAAVGTLIAGVYGMNFEYMPELGWLLGYPFALGLMAVSSVVLYRLFRRSGWL